MSRVDELIMIIPVVLNLKGNLEMNLSARLSTATNMGELDRPKARRQIILGNLTLLQVQATVVSFVAALVAFGLGRIMPSPAPRDPQDQVEGIFTRRTFTGRPLTQARRPRPSPLPKSDPGGLTESVILLSPVLLLTY
jgi:solute carrier family 41